MKTAPSPYNSVLVPLDGSHVAAEALSAAATLARQADCHLMLLHVLPPEEESQPRETRVRRTQMEAYLQGLTRSLRQTGLQVDYRIEQGEAAPTILDVAAALARPMLVLTNSGMGGVTEHHEDATGDVFRQIEAVWQGPLVRVEA